MQVQRIKAADGESGTVLGKVSQLAADLVHSTKNLAGGQPDDKGEEPEYLQAGPSARLSQPRLPVCTATASFGHRAN